MSDIHYLLPSICSNSYFVFPSVSQNYEENHDCNDRLPLNLFVEILHAWSLLAIIYTLFFPSFLYCSGRYKIHTHPAKHVHGSHYDLETLSKYLLASLFPLPSLCSLLASGTEHFTHGQHSSWLHGGNGVWLGRGKGVRGKASKSGIGS